MSLVGGQTPEGSNTGGLFVQFNQDCTSLVAGSSNGYHLFSLTADDGLEEIYASHSGLDTCLVDRLFSSSLVAIVTISNPRKLIVCHFKKGTEICNYSYSNTILAVKLNRARLIVCLEESLHIHNIRDMKVLHTIRETPPNPRGLCALSPSVDCCYVAYPGSSAVGEVQIFDAVHLNAKTVIPAHDSPLAALAFSSSGARLATASERGTVIRVFSVHDRQKLFEFRRGVKRCVTICSLAFSTCGLYLCCSSNTETVHVFKLVDAAKETAPPEETGASGTWMGWVAAAVSAGAGYLPAQVAGVLAQGRAVASARLPVAGVRSAAAITTIQKNLRLLVATSEGYLYIYSLDAIEGGECMLVRQHRFINEDSLSQSLPINVEKESEKLQVMAMATESPPKGGFNFDDDKEFPPMTQKAE